MGSPDDGQLTPTLRRGVVATVSPLTVLVGSAATATACNALTSYSPAVGDVVSVLVLNGDRLVVGTVVPGAWIPWSPTISQPSAVTATVTNGGYSRDGRTITASADLAITGTGTAANIVRISLPADAAHAGANRFIGTGKIFDSSTGLEYWGAVVLASSTQCQIGQMVSGAGATYYGSGGFTAALAVGDVVAFELRYEATT